MKTKRIECNFVGSFKVGDNLGYNAGILRHLVARNEGGRFNKMIVLQVGSILEAALHQIIYRAQNYNKEGVPNIAEADRREIEARAIDKFAVVIDVMKKYKILDGLGRAVYKELHTLRKYRNKIHIQNSLNITDVPFDEVKAFSNKLTCWALDLNLTILDHLQETYPRPKRVGVACNPLLIPAPCD